jgi:hypothetical protein
MLSLIRGAAREKSIIGKGDMTMKRFLLLSASILALLTSGLAIASDAAYVKTDKTMYLMDPYYWVYKAANYISVPGPGWENPGYWPVGGYPRDVNFSVKTYDATGKIKDLGSLSYNVLGVPVPKTGPVATTADPGIYSGSFQLTDDDLGGAAFTGQQPKQLALQILDSANRVVKEQAVYFGRWGCDRCHIGNLYGEEGRLPDGTLRSFVAEVYPWAEPTGGINSPYHSWANVLGRAFDPNGFNLKTLQDVSKAHTPGNYLNDPTGHERTIHKWAGDYKCSPCHGGINHNPADPPPPDFKQLRPVWDANLRGIPWARADAVECTYCHSIEGGYVPASGSWADNAGYITPAHGHKNVDALVNDLSIQVDPWLARQNCANIGCHGHINATKNERIDHAKPDCRLCHGIHNSNPH